MTALASARPPRAAAAAPGLASVVDLRPAPDMEPDDDALMARAGGGDQRAFARLVARHGPRAQAVAHRFTGSAAEAEDIVQEAFWRVWRSADRWAPGGARFSTWLHRVVVNLCVDHDRRKRIRRFLPFADLFDPPADDPGPAREAEARGEIAAVRADILALPARQRAALLLAADGERSNAEIAATLGASEKAVESMLVRARRTLRARQAAREESAR
ncbi:RNA polymerase sigma factor [Methylopila jiangsuensis]|uniref:RNA polymerase sigma factor n=1 Tax=Methylopila jiangsuensis TaxID=586230 RepID=A0A9W6JK59_9HYPH|nr:sigma-70 family RNA polymerase sigma factor [Methylopila jiangsuensis]MDR6285064.1 RNA polymerase sigma-70 factor (ECF subfamily) [Methylopila jiangsuensis]GLK77549.1 RNA polymerase sigma factor [Methylopila jiangsuensis]